MKCTLFDNTRNTDTMDLTEAEAELVKLFVREVRHAATLKTQLLVTVGPWFAGDRVRFSASYTAFSDEVTGRVRARAIRGRKKAR